MTATSLAVLVVLAIVAADVQSYDSSNRLTAYRVCRPFCSRTPSRIRYLLLSKGQKENGPSNEVKAANATGTSQLGPGNNATSDPVRTDYGVYEPRDRQTNCYLNIAYQYLLNWYQLTVPPYWPDLGYCEAPEYYGPWYGPWSHPWPEQEACLMPYGEM